MSSVSALARIDGAVDGYVPGKLLRLGDADKIAAERLDSASISSLKEALAGVNVKDPSNAGPRLADRIDAVLGNFDAPGKGRWDAKHCSSGSMNGQAVPAVASALDVAGRLASDASVAAEAIETLKHLLQAQLAAGIAASDRATDQQLPASSDPPPLPNHVSLTVAPPDAAADRVDAHPADASLASAPGERRRVDVLGFVAGFVLSGAIGAMLYLYMMAG